MGLAEGFLDPAREEVVERATAADQVRLSGLEDESLATDAEMHRVGLGRARPR